MDVHPIFIHPYNGRVADIFLLVANKRRTKRNNGRSLRVEAQSLASPDPDISYGTETAHDTSHPFYTLSVVSHYVITITLI